MAKIKVTESEYNAMIQKAEKAAAEIEKSKNSDEVNSKKVFTHYAHVPTIKSLQANGIDPDSIGPLNKLILPYLVFYAEQHAVGKDRYGDTEYEYIFNPEKVGLKGAELSEFLKTRKFIEKVITKKVEIG